jgi:hypothetical protein
MPIFTDGEKAISETDVVRTLIIVQNKRDTIRSADVMSRAAHRSRGVVAATSITLSKR